MATGEKLFYSRDNGATWIDITASVSGTAVSAVDSQLTSTNTIQMQVRDAAGNAGATDSQLVTIDTTAPTQETTDPLNPAAGKASLVLGSITADNVVNTGEGAQANVAVTGTARGDFTAGDVVTLTVNSKTFTGTVAADGKFSINVPGADLLADGDKTVAASLAAKDKAGNTGTISDDQLYSVDNAAPSTTVNITGITDDTGVSGTDFITNDNNGLTVSATLSAALATGEKLFYSRDNGVTWSDITGSVNGTAVSAVDNQLTSTATIQMQVRNAAGNPGATESQLVTIDTTAPTEESTNPLSPAVGKASLVVDSITADNIVNANEGAQASVAVTGTVRGDFTAGDVVTLTVNGKIFTGEVDVNGRFSINVTGPDLLADGDKTIAAVLAARDVAGNLGIVTETQVYTTDTTAPTTTVNITAITNDTGVSNSDFITADNNGLTVSAALSAALATGEKLFYSRDNGVTWIDITASVSGTAVSAVDSQLTSTSTIQMQVRDAAGNLSATDSQLVIIDASGSTTQPSGATDPNTSATVSITAISADSGVSSSDFITNDKTLSYSGKVSNFTANGDLIELVLKDSTGAVVGGTFVMPASNGTWTWDNTSVTRADGNYSLTATVVDAAGNRTNTATGGQDSQVVTIDSSDSQNTDNSNGSNTPVTDVNATATVSIDAISVDSGTSTTDFITNDKTLSYSGTVSNFTANGDVVELVLKDSTGAVVGGTFVTPANNGAWTWDNTSVTRADGNYTLTATVVDKAGNRVNTAAGGTDNQVVTIDSTSPGQNENGQSAAQTKPIVSIPEATSGLSADELTDGVQTEVTLPSGTKAGDKITLTVTDPSGDKRTVDHIVTPNEATAGKSSVTVPKTAVSEDGSYSVSAVVTDVAGNSSASSEASLFTLDTTSPTAPGTSLSIDSVTLDNVLNASEASQTNTAVTGKVSGEFIAGDVVTLTVNQKTFSGTVDASGSYSINVTTSDLVADIDKKIDASIAAHDTAGNTGTITASKTYNVDTEASNANVGLKISISTDANNDAFVNSTELSSATTFTSRITVNSSAAVGDKVVITASNGSTALTPITRVLTSADIVNGFDVTFAKPTEGQTQTVTANYVDSAGNAATDAAPSDSAKLDTTATNNSTVGLAIAISTDANNDAIVNSVELSGVNTFTSHVTVNSSAVAGDKVVISASNGSTALTPITHVLTAADITDGFDVTFTKPADAQIQTVTAKYMDAAGNIATDAAPTDSAKLDALNVAISGGKSTSTTFSSGTAVDNVESAVFVAGAGGKVTTNFWVAEVINFSGLNSNNREAYVNAFASFAENGTSGKAFKMNEVNIQGPVSGDPTKNFSQNAPIQFTSRVGTFTSLSFDYTNLQNTSKTITIFDSTGSQITSGSISSFGGTWSSGTLSRAASFFQITGGTLDLWEIDNVTSAASNIPSTVVNTLADGASVLSTTPTLNGTLTRALVTGESVRIFQDGVDKGAATVSGTTWTFGVTLAQGSTSSFVAKVLNGSSVVNAESGSFSLKQSATGVTPLVLDLTDTGIDTTTQQNGILFDIDGNGTLDQTAWIKGGNGLLVMDLNHDGQINSGRELFGAGTVLKTGQNAADGFQALADLDSNSDGIMNDNDAEFSKLQVWVDANGNGNTDAGELKSLTELDIVSLDLHSKAYDGIQNGNSFGLISNFTTKDGQSHQLVDVWLQAAEVSTLDLTRVEVLELVKEFSTIDLSATQNNTLKLDWSAVSALSREMRVGNEVLDTVKLMVISGNVGDVIELADLESWTQGSVLSAESLSAVYGSIDHQFLAGHAYKMLTLQGATVFIDEAMALTTVTPTDLDAQRVEDVPVAGSVEWQTKPYDFSDEELAQYDVPMQSDAEVLGEEGASVQAADGLANLSNVYSFSQGQSLNLDALLQSDDASVAQSAPTHLDMASDSVANVLHLTMTDVLSLPATNGIHQLTLTGAANDKLMLTEGEWTDSGQVINQEGHTYSVYTGTHNASAQLLLDQQILQSHQSS